MTEDEAIEIVFNKIKNMSEKEFKEALKKHEDGDIAKMLRELWVDTLPETHH